MCLASLIARRMSWGAVELVSADQRPWAIRALAARAARAACGCPGTARLLNRLVAVAVPPEAVLEDESREAVVRQPNSGAPPLVEKSQEMIGTPGDDDDSGTIGGTLRRPAVGSRWPSESSSKGSAGR